MQTSRASSSSRSHFSTSPILLLLSILALSLSSSIATAKSIDAMPDSDSVDNLVPDSSSAVIVSISDSDNVDQQPAVVEQAATSDEESKADESTATTKWKFNAKTCNIYENEPLHAIMDRVCELCHDMYSHQNPNMRVECRSNCFRSENFKKCLRLFKPSRGLRRQNRTRN